MPLGFRDLFLSLLITLSCLPAHGEQPRNLKVLPPERGAYHGAYADFGPAETAVTKEAIEAYIHSAGKKIAWAYFSNHWLDGEIVFPKESVEICKSLGVVPYIRFSPWSEMIQSRGDPITKMENILAGKFDDQLRAWARAARDFDFPLMMEFGPEVNGDWFPWNGRWNGGAEKSGYGDPNIPDGPERFRDSYRHIIDIFRSENAHNITWILHVDVAWTPQQEWNKMKYYHPGDDYIDWIGLSVFGRQLPKSNWILFPAMLKNFLGQIEESSSLPILISEFGVIEDAADPERKARWLRQALQSVSKGMFKRVKGITYWNSPGWLPEGKASFKIDSSEPSLRAFRDEIASPFWLENVETGLSRD
jgi:hypothetical protein